MSGLLVKSTVIMKETLSHLRALGHATPEICGVAALTRGYVEHNLQNAYTGRDEDLAAAGATAEAAPQRASEAQPRSRVFYAKDAFEGLALMDELCGHVPPDKITLT